MRPRLSPTSLLLVAGLWLATGSLAAPACPKAGEIEAGMLTGRWQITWTDGARQRGETPWLLELQAHPEYAGSLKGQLNRDGERRLVVADWDDETLTMEESADGQRIDATWQATVSEGSCARALQGLRFTGSAPDASARRFRMRALP